MLNVIVTVHWCQNKHDMGHKHYSLFLLFSRIRKHRFAQFQESTTIMGKKTENLK